MTRVSLFNSPLVLGFEQIERTLDRITKSGDGYPPYNIEQIGEEGFRVTLAVAGFSTNDLQVSVEENQLMVRGRQHAEENRVYLHRGIASRQFQRSFVLADGIEVTNAHVDNGLLHIDLARPKAEPVVRHIKINLLIRGTPPVGIYVFNMFCMTGSRLWGSRLHRACVV